MSERAGQVSGAPRVLLADDDPVSRTVGRRLLLSLGASCEVADDGQAAVEAVARGGFDLVLMDCEMPRLDGIAATRAIRAAEREGRLAVVAVTSHSDEDTRARCAAAGVDELVPKPLSRPLLEGILARWVSGRRAPEPRPQSAPSRPAGLLSLLELERETGREGFARMVIDRYLIKAEAAIEGLTTALTTGDADTVRRTAHTLKGSSGTVGADAVGALAKQLEAGAADEGALEALLPLTEELASALAAYRAEVADV